MFLYHNQQWIEDIDKILKIIPEIEGMAGKAVLITGASGLICSAIVDTLFRWNDTHSEKIKILAAGRSEHSIQGRFGSMMLRSDFDFVPYDAASYENNIPVNADFIIHGAGNAYPARVMMEPVETMLGNFLGIKGLLDYARINGLQRILYISSSEVYGKKESNNPYCENEYGYVDLLNARNSYANGKRAAEAMCASYSAEYGVDYVIVRPGHIYGPTASAEDMRVSSAWPYLAARGEDIIMKSNGGQIRSYCYCLDCASAILKILLSGESNRAYNISNPDSIITIRELAEIIADQAGVQLKMELPTENEKLGFNPMNNSSLESERLLNLGWHGCFSARDGITHTVSIIRQNSSLLINGEGLF